LAAFGRPTALCPPTALVKSPDSSTDIFTKAFFSVECSKEDTDQLFTCLPVSSGVLVPEAATEERIWRLKSSWSSSAFRGMSIMTSYADFAFTGKLMF